MDARYLQYEITVQGGRVVTGIIDSETATTLLLKSAEGETTLSRAEIREIRATGLSLMPVGFEQQIDPRQMADLLAYLEGIQYDIGTEKEGFSPEER